MLLSPHTLLWESVQVMSGVLGLMSVFNSLRLWATLIDYYRMVLAVRYLTTCNLANCTYTVQVFHWQGKITSYCKAKVKLWHLAGEMPILFCVTERSLWVSVHPWRFQGIPTLDHTRNACFLFWQSLVQIKWLPLYPSISHSWPFQACQQLSRIYCESHNFSASLTLSRLH